MDKQDRRLPSTAGSQVDSKDHIAMPVGPAVGISPITSIAATAQEGIGATQGRTAAVPEGAVAEPARDDVALSTTQARFRVPDWFAVVWSNRKARIGLILLGFFVFLAVFADVVAPYNPKDISFGPSEQPSAQH